MGREDQRLQHREVGPLLVREPEEDDGGHGERDEAGPHEQVPHGHRAVQGRRGCDHGLLLPRRGPCRQHAGGAHLPDLAGGVAHIHRGAAQGEGAPDPGPGGGGQEAQGGGGAGQAEDGVAEPPLHGAVRRGDEPRGAAAGDLRGRRPADADEPPRLCRGQPQGREPHAEGPPGVHRQQRRAVRVLVAAPRRRGLPGVQLEGAGGRGWVVVLAGPRRLREPGPRPAPRRGVARPLPRGDVGVAVGGVRAGLEERRHCRLRKGRGHRALRLPHEALPQADRVHDIVQPHRPVPQLPQREGAVHRQDSAAGHAGAEDLRGLGQQEQVYSGHVQAAPRADLAEGATGPLHAGHAAGG
mmetsp:Transcript_66469/g.185776  ORF Transcript_66469/g.185776 Transcript_66469/m.185776 type:complete len:354 (-) Transcript_66469:268-1329(-)